MKSRGNCRWNGKLKLCTAHQELCIDHGIIHLKVEQCGVCEKRFYTAVTTIIIAFANLYSQTPKTNDQERPQRKGDQDGNERGNQASVVA